MTAALPKRLIEVDLPIKRISEHARREKSIRHGHISTLHIWWARRPIAACRAILCASLWPDPADPNCPDSFRVAARRWMTKWSNEYLRALGRQSYERFIGFQNNPGRLDDNEQLRYALLDFIADFANWDNSIVKEYLETSRALTQAAHEALGGAAGTRPLVVDPFAGGGSIPLEALRVGADAFASDLNPIPVLLNKVILEYIPKYGHRLVDDVRKWGKWITSEAEKELATFYPTEADGRPPIAYLWARTIKCEGPNCGSEVPLLRTLVLASRADRSVALNIIPMPRAKRVEFRFITKQQHEWSSEEQPEEKIREPKLYGTVRGGSATCPCCGFTTPKNRVREQLREKRGGTDESRLICVVTRANGGTGRQYRHPSAGELQAFERARSFVADSDSELNRRFIPTEEIPQERVWKNNPIRVHLYGMTRWRDIFSSRQALTLATLSRLVKLLPDNELWGKENPGLSVAVATCLALAVDRQADYCSSLCTWVPSGEFVGHTFGRQAIPMVWDFIEVVPFADSTGGFIGALEWVANVLEREAQDSKPVGHVECVSATKHPLPDDAAAAFITDPPYYDAVPYSTLSNFFYVWLKRAVPASLEHLFAEHLAPNADECVVDEAKGKTHGFYESTMQQAMAEGFRVLQPSGIGLVVFAHKSTAGWEALLQAVMDAGWTITGSWPIDTEMGTRLRARNSAALASSVHLVCRPRTKPNELNHKGSEVGDWRDVLQQLPLRIHEWMPRLAEEGVVGADAIFACIGPALEIFSRYTRVEKANGDHITLQEYLVYVWAAVAKEALTMVFKGADASGFEEDARLTAIWLWTLFAGEGRNGEETIEEVEIEEATEGTSVTAEGYVLEYDAARKIAQGLGADLESLTSLVEIKGDVARLLPVSERTGKLFGKDEGETSVARRRKKGPQLQLGFVAELEQVEEAGAWGTKGAPAQGATVLDRVHQSMILFAAGRGEALRRFLVDESVGRDERFWRLAQVLSFLYPKLSDEKRWIDGVLARKKGLGF